MGQIAWRIKDIKEVCQGWMDNNFDGLIVFDGNRGLGKSTAALKLCHSFKQFHIKKDLVFTRQKLMQRLTRKKEIILADEMINIAHNREHWLKDQLDLIKCLNMYRDNGNILCACIPNFYDLDKQFRGLVKMRINIIRRGVGVVHTKNQSSFSSDKWDLANNERVERRWSISGNFKPNYKKLTTFRGILRFSALSEKQEKEYFILKEERRNRIFEDKQKESEAEGFEIAKFIIQGLTENRITTKQEVMNICLAKNEKFASVVKKINTELSNQGRIETLSQLLVQHNKKKFIEKEVEEGEKVTMQDATGLV